MSTRAAFVGCQVALLTCLWLEIAVSSSPPSWFIALVTVFALVEAAAGLIWLERQKL